MRNPTSYDFRPWLAAAATAVALSAVLLPFAAEAQRAPGGGGGAKGAPSATAPLARQAPLAAANPRGSGGSRAAAPPAPRSAGQVAAGPAGPASKQTMAPTAASSRSAARGVSAGRAGTPRVTAPARPTPQARAQFNRQTVGATSDVNKALRERAYRRLDQLHAAQGRPIGVKVKPFGNDGRNQTPVLPRVTPGGKPIGYTELRLRGDTAGRSYANGRVALGTDGKAYLSRHHGDPMRGGTPGMGKVVRIQ